MKSSINLRAGNQNGALDQSIEPISRKHFLNLNVLPLSNFQLCYLKVSIFKFSLVQVPSLNCCCIFVTIVTEMFYQITA